MHFPRYWASYESEGVRAWQWSDVSEDDARAKARERVRQIAQWLKERPAERAQYGYGAGPLREEILRRDETSAVPIVVTRNRYGAEVLNVENALFIDIDETDTDGARARSLLDTVMSLFRAAPEKPRQTSTGVQERTAAWVRRNSAFGFRVYRTCGGYRLLATQAPIHVESADAERALGELGADPLYRRLCKSQRSFRARLTPKPWRIGIESPPHLWPHTSSRAHDESSQWLARYREASAAYAVCDLVATVGDPKIAKELQPLVAFHDDACGVNSGKQLA